MAGSLMGDERSAGPPAVGYGSSRDTAMAVDNCTRHRFDATPEGFSHPAARRARARRREVRSTRAK